MLGRSALVKILTLARAGGLSVALAVCALVLPDMAQAQERGPVQLVASSPDGNAKADLFEQIGRWWDRSMNGLNAGMRDGLTDFRKLGDNTRDAVQGAATAAGSAAASFATLPNTRIIRRRQRCEPAANGGPDCQRAASAVCRAVGYSRGSSLEVQSEEQCPMEVLVSQRRPEPGECRIETYVLQSVCQ